MAADYGRGHRRYKEARARYRAHAEAHALACWLCRQPIDYRLRRGPASWSLDHRIPLSKGGPLLDWTNFRPAHLRCNSSRGNGPTGPAAPLTGSRRW